MKLLLSFLVYWAGLILIFTENVVSFCIAICNNLVTDGLDVTDLGGYPWV